jgi:Ohr subfamily peroxiredoxin
VQSSDSRLRLELSSPSMRAGPCSEGTNPEQLLAAAYAACFLSAIRQAGREADVAIPADFNVTARFEVAQDAGTAETPGFEITLMVDLPGIEPAQRHALVERAHAISRCSRAMRRPVAVRTVTD